MRLHICCVLMFALAASAQDKPKLDLRGDRFPGLNYEQLTPAQRLIADRALSGRGAIGIFNIMLRGPELDEAILRYGAYERFHMPLPARLTELAALITIRAWSSQYLWYEHRRAASEAGLSEAVIKNIGQGKRPAGLGPDEEAVYNFCAQLLRTTQMTDATFNMVKWQLAERGVVEIMGEIGYYQTAAMLLNMDRYPLPDRIAPELQPLANPIP